MGEKTMANTNASPAPVCNKWESLLNIDDSNQNTLHSFQILFKHETCPNIYIYSVFEKMCPQIICTNWCALNLGFTDSQIKSGNATQLSETIIAALQWYLWLSEIKNFIRSGTHIYNGEMEKMTGDKAQMFVWREPKWHSFIDKNAINWSEVYQIDQALLSEIQDCTAEVIGMVSEMIKTQTLNATQLRAEIIWIILQKQSEIHWPNMDSNIEEMKNIKFDFERVMYREHERNRRVCAEQSRVWIVPQRRHRQIYEQSTVWRGQSRLWALVLYLQIFCDWEWEINCFDCARVWNRKRVRKRVKSLSIFDVCSLCQSFHSAPKPIKTK